MKKYFIPIILLLVIFGACNQNQKKGKLSLKLESENSDEFILSNSLARYGLPLSLDSQNNLFIYYIVVRKQTAEFSLLNF